MYMYNIFIKINAYTQYQYAGFWWPHWMFLKYYHALSVIINDWHSFVNQVVHTHLQTIPSLQQYLYANKCTPTEG